ncbi:MAG: hypothetical protein ACI4FZ_09940 [Lachnospiraceae bacterium]
MENKFTFMGHTFEDEKQLLMAKKEAEAIEYLRAKTDFNNGEMLLRLYNRILDKKMMETEVGIDFLVEIRKRIVEIGIMKENQLRDIPELKKRAAKKKAAEKKSRELLLLEKARRQNTVLKIVCLFLAALVIGMFVILLTGKRSPLAVRYEEEILNKYASWAQELTEKEHAINDRLAELRKQGIIIEDTAEAGTETDSGSEGVQDAN